MAAAQSLADLSMHILLFANGSANSGTMVQRVLDSVHSPYILCADGGALNATKFGFAPQTIIGDLDSLTERQLSGYESVGAEILHYPAEKDETDLELALKWCVEHSAKSIYILGGLGGRFDQTLANIYLLSLPQLEPIQVEVVDAEQSIRLLRPHQHTIQGHSGDTISLLPMSDRVQGITTSGLKYPLKDESLYLGPARGVSNVLLEDSATIAFQDGLLLMVHTNERA